MAKRIALMAFTAAVLGMMNGSASAHTVTDAGMEDAVAFFAANPAEFQGLLKAVHNGDRAGGELVAGRAGVSLDDLSRFGQPTVVANAATVKFRQSLKFRPGSLKTKSQILKKSKIFVPKADASW